VLGGLAASPAWAAGQDATSAQPADQSAMVEEVVVTGSRIRRSDLTSPSPVNIIDDKAFAASGAMQVAEALNQLPQLGTASGARSQNNNSLNNGFGFGSELINLRNLGAQRTLVVVNGRRHVGGDPGTSSVDLNAIPSSMVERIDVVTGAASAVYGADAVSGVVNIVLKSKYTGAEVSARYGESSRGDGSEFLLSALVGDRFASDKGHILLGAEYAKTKAILASDRPYGFADPGGNVATFGALALANGSTTVAGGRFVASNTYFDDAGVFRPFPSNGSANYQRWPRKYIQNPSSRKLVSVVADYEVLNGGPITATAYSEISYSQSQTTFQYEPTLANFTGGNYGTVNEAPFEAPRIPANNPFLLNLPPAVLAAIGPIPAAGLAFARRFEEFGNRHSIIDRDTLRVVTGVRGELGKKFNYDLYYQYGNVSAQQDDQGTIDKNRVIAALDVNNNGTPTNLADDTCASVYYRNLGCTPVNLFGPGTITPAFIKYATIPGISASDATQQVVSGYVSGDLFTLPAGPVGIVAGAEYRKEDVAVMPAQTFVEGSNFTKKVLGVDAGYDVKEVFGEINVPVIRDHFLAKSLEIGAAVRYSDYSTVGEQTSWSARGDWSVNSILRFRATYGTAVRAPNLNELYAGRVAAISNVVDPCDTFNDATSAPIVLSATRVANCQAALGAAQPSFNQTQFQQQTVGNISQGNPGLDAEAAKTRTIGVVLTPDGALRGLSLTADFYDIDIKKVISRLTIQNVVNQCYDTPGLPAVFCGQVNRAAGTGQLLSVNNSFLNASSELLRGVDVTLGYQTELDRFLAVPGAINAKITWAHLYDHNFQQNAGAGLDRRAGQVGDFEDRLDIAAAYQLENLTISWNARMLGEAVADTSQNLGPRADIDAVWYHDAQLNYGFRDGRLSWTLGAKNLFDKQPPIITAPARTNENGGATVLGIYDTRGRFFYTSLTARF
jgi:outer membrane receptor protein involved in Fe transport